MARKKLDSDRISRIFLLVGEETFLRDRRLRELETEWSPVENPEYNTSVFHGPDIDLGAVVAAADTLPIFSPHRLIVLRDLDVADAAVHKDWMAYLERPNPTTVILATAASTTARRKGDKASGSTAAVKTLLERISAVEEFSALRPERAQQMVRDAAKSRGVDISQEAVLSLIEVVGVDAARLDSEIEKASLYTGGRRIEGADIEQLAWRTRGHTLFELTDAIARGDGEELLRQLAALFDDGNDALSLTGMAAWHMRRTLRAAAILESGATSGQMARAVGISWSIAERFAETSRRLGTLGAARAILTLRSLDVRLKSTAEDKRRAVERAFIELLPRAAAARHVPG